MFVALGIQHAMLIRRITLPSVARLSIQYFPKLSHKRYDFRKTVTEHKMYVSLQLLSETFFIVGRNEQDIIKNVYWS